MVKLNRMLRKIRIREIKNNYKNYFSMILIAMLCVALFTGLLANYYHFKDNISSIYQDSNMGDLFVTTSSYDEKDLDYLNRVFGVDEITPRLYTEASINHNSVVVLGYENQYVSHPASYEGNLGVLINEKFAKNNSIEIGSMIELSISNFLKNTDFSTSLSPYVLKDDILKNDSLLLEFKVTGLMTHSEALSGTNISSGVIYASMDNIKESIISLLDSNYGSTIEALNQIVLSEISNSVLSFHLSNQYVIKTAEDKKESIENYYSSKENNNLIVILTKSTLPTNSDIEADLIQSKQLLFVFPLVFYLVGLLVIITSISQLIHKEHQNIGIMSSLGMSKISIIWHYASFTIAVTFIGGFLGLVLGPILIPRVMNIKYSILYVLPEVKHSIIYLYDLVCFLILFLLSFIVAIVVSYQIVSQRPSIILRNIPSSNFKGSIFDKMKAFQNHASLNLKMSFRNIKRHASRSIMVLLGVLGCSALLVCGFGIDNTLDYGINQEVNHFLNYDISCSFNSLETFYEIEQNENVALIDSYYKESIKAYSDQSSIDTQIYILNNTNSIIEIPMSSTGITLTKKVADKLKLTEGDFISFLFQNEQVKFKISIIQELCITQGIFIDSNLFLSNVFDASFKDNCLYARVFDRNKLSETTLELKNIDGISQVINKDDFISKVNNALSSIRLITLTVKVFAILLAIIVIFNLALLNFKERVRDIATLKVLGFGQKEVAKNLLTEITILTVIGSILGMFLGKPLLILLLTINETEIIQYIYHIYFVSYLYSIILTIAVSLIINLCITVYTKKIEMVESLKSVE